MSRADPFPAIFELSFHAIRKESELVVSHGIQKLHSFASMAKAIHDE